MIIIFIIIIIVTVIISIIIIVTYKKKLWPDGYSLSQDVDGYSSILRILVWLYFF